MSQGIPGIPSSPEVPENGWSALWGSIVRGFADPKRVAKLERSGAEFETAYNNEGTAEGYKGKGRNRAYTYDPSKPLTSEEAAAQQGVLLTVGKNDLHNTWLNRLNAYRASGRRAGKTDEQLEMDIIRSTDPDIIAARNGLTRLAVNPYAVNYMRKEDASNNQAIQDYLLKQRFGGKTLNQLTPDEKEQFNEALSINQELNQRDSEAEFLRRIHNIGTEGAEGERHIDQAHKVGFSTFYDDVNVAKRVLDEQSAGILPAREDLARMVEINKSPARRNALAYARRRQFFSNKANYETVDVGGRKLKFVKPGMKPEYTLPRYEQLTNEQLAKATKAYQNYGHLSALQEMRDTNPILWFLKTLFTDPKRFFSIVNFMNSNNAQELELNKNPEFNAYLPWLNVANNLVGSIYNPKGSGFQYHG